MFDCQKPLVQIVGKRHRRRLNKDSHILIAQSRREPLGFDFRNLTDKADVAFDELLTDTTYVAIVNIKDFLACATEHNRSALFFLSAISKHGSISAASAGTATPIRIQQLLRSALTARAMP